MEPLQQPMTNASLKTVKFNALSLGAFSVLLPNVWAFSSLGLVAGLYAGGIPALVYGAIVAGVLLTIVSLSLAEFGSALPSSAGCTYISATIGGPRFGPACGFATGALHSFSALITPAAVITALTPLVLTIGTVANPEWRPTPWQTYLVYLGLTIVCIFGCIRGARVLNVISNVCAVVLFVLLFVVAGLFLGLPDGLSPSSVVWAKLDNSTGWSDSFALVVGFGASFYAFGPVHWILNMAEEVENPGRSIPIAFFMQQVGNVASLLLFYLCIGYGIGNDWASITTTTYPAPVGAIFEHLIGNKAGTLCLIIVMSIILAISIMSYITASASLLYGFALTGALPFSDWLSKFDVQLQSPKNILYLMFVVNSLLGLIQVGSSSALMTLVSGSFVLYTVGYAPMFIGYLITGGRYLDRNRYFKLPRGISLALAAFNLVSILVQGVILCSPPLSPITVKNMNWASVIVGGVSALVLVCWFLSSRKLYLWNQVQVLEAREGVYDGKHGEVIKQDVASPDRGLEGTKGFSS